MRGVVLLGVAMIMGLLVIIGLAGTGSENWTLVAQQVTPYFLLAFGFAVAMIVLRGLRR